MSKFHIEYEHLKVILNAFYNSTYRNVAHFLDSLHGIKEVDTGITLKEKVDAENAANAPQPEAKE